MSLNDSVRTLSEGCSMETLIKKHLHHVSVDEAVQLLDVDSQKGLDEFEIEARQKRFGPNTIPTQTGSGPLKRLLLQFHQPLVYILIAAGTITGLLQEWVDSGVIFGVVLVNALIGYLQESKAAKALEALANTVTTDATVVRAGKTRNVPSTELVPGDIVLLQSGDKVPADLRLIETRDLQIDESALTGESVPVEKHSQVYQPDTPLAERQNMAYSSTLVTYGQGRGVIFATGSHTEVGRISELISEADILQTPLTRKVTWFSQVLLVVILILAAITFGIGVLRGESAYVMFMAAVALAVGAIPEGLPAAVTITLAIGVARMARRRAIIRRLPAVETLGSTTIICSDKTGTLTENQMTVRAIWAGGEQYKVTGVGYAASGTIHVSGNESNHDLNVAARECLLAGLLCNDSRLVKKEARWEVQGDPTEGALLTSAAKAGLDNDELITGIPRIDVIPFESEYQYMATLHEMGTESPGRIYVKGAMEVILSKCTSALNASGECVPLPLEKIKHEFDQLATQGLRVLAFARGEIERGTPDTNRLSHANVSNLTFLGLQGMIDPPRAEAIAAVKACQTAGVRVKMITGDHALTAAAIAQQVGLDGMATQSDTPPKVVSGKELTKISDRDLINVAETSAVFARVTPEEKLRLVRALQAQKQIVAMTGDGVNDAPALKQADIGVAMGVGGTEVAKEAADMVLTDDNFASIEAAVEEGRGVFDNLTKFIVWTLPTNLGEGLVILAAVFLGVTLPILPVQILWINMTTAVLLGLMLAFEPKEEDIMQRPPRDPDTPLLTRDLIGRIFLVGTLLLVGAFGLFEWALLSGSSIEEARTIAVNVFVMVELFYLFNCRSLTRSMFQLGLLSNLWVVGGAAIMIVLQLLYTYAPSMNRLFHSTPIGWNWWGWILAVGITAYCVVGFEKWIRRRQTSLTSKEN
ncbi:putative cation-transporting ATPase F [Gimesia aquarii]|uniref:Putative cation-transporting ATPase F n=2 Tax=Gimesia aquarii TaxID=2527964 RepID=A0A517WX88_9PLAN|nr:putative cation-transporting ATPase F [Gimesia aquarii]